MGKDLGRELVQLELGVVMVHHHIIEIEATVQQDQMEDLKQDQPVVATANMAKEPTDLDQGADNP